ncbi:hypothetical protein GIB67_034995, partial [Kingdonia uniflora]
MVPTISAMLVLFQSQPVVPLDVTGFDDHHGLRVVCQMLRQSKASEYVFQDGVGDKKLFEPFFLLFSTSKWYNGELGIAAFSHLQFWLEQELKVPKWGSHDPGGSRRNWSFYQSRSNEVESRSNDLNPWAKVPGEGSFDMPDVSHEYLRDSIVAVWRNFKSDFYTKYVKGKNPRVVKADIAPKFVNIDDWRTLYVSRIMPIGRNWKHLH